MPNYGTDYERKTTYNLMMRTITKTIISLSRVYFTSHVTCYEIYLIFRLYVYPIIIKQITVSSRLLSIIKNVKVLYNVLCCFKLTNYELSFIPVPMLTYSFKEKFMGTPSCLLELNGKNDVSLIMMA